MADRRAEVLLAEGRLGPEIAKILRDEGHKLSYVIDALHRLGFPVITEMSLQRGYRLATSNKPLEGKEREIWLEKALESNRPKWISWK